MAHSICYLIDVPGTAFNGLMRRSHQAPAGYVEQLQRDDEADYWDGMLPDTETLFLVDLTGRWTLCKLPYSYSAWLFGLPEGEAVTRTTEWEGALRRSLPKATIIRLDDFLLDPWNARHDYLLIRKVEAVRDFITWLSSQDPRSWTQLPRATPATIEGGA